MKPTAKEQQRAFNIIWSAAEDYTIHATLSAYDENGRAQRYWNFIIGAAYKYLDFAKLQEYFDLLGQESASELYINLTWLALEHHLYYKVRQSRPVLDEMRKDHARETLRKMGSPDPRDLYGTLHRAKLRSVLGEAVQLEEPVQRLLSALEFEETLETGEIIHRMDQILWTYFKLNRAHAPERQIGKTYGRTKLFHFGQKSTKIKGMPYIKRVSIGSAEKTDVRTSGGASDLKDRVALQWLSFRERMDQSERQEIESSFGASFLSEAQTRVLEQAVCLDDHKTCHIHMTKGEFTTGSPRDIQDQEALSQRIRNEAYHQAHIARINASIARLAHKIKNTTLVDFQSAPVRSVAGDLLAGKIWRSTILNDSKVFSKSMYDELGDLSVDILLDASASQIRRQEIIAAQGYIIAQALTRCNIPVKVYSFCTRRSFTVINQFRDYADRRNNHQIFRYYATGFNRDGLALRLATHMMASTAFEKRILIVLSDGKPNDMAKLTGSGLNLSGQDYSDRLAVEDAAREVRAGRKKGISILCVFTGKDQDLPAAKKIYGRSLTHIQSPERFADMVGILIQHELTNQL